VENKEVNTILWIGTAVTLLLGCGLIFLVLFYQNYFAKRRRKEAERLLKTALESEKNERKRIAADIHDGVSGDLNAVRNFIRILQKQEADEDKISILKGMNSGVEAALENTRSISYKLMPPLLESAGLVAAIEDYFERLTAAYPKIDFSVEALNEIILAPEKAYEIFRIIQEFSTNMIKYGKVSKCKIMLSGTQSEVIIEIIENGVPYNFDALFKVSKGAGLSNIRSRLKILEAGLEQKKAITGNHFSIVIKTPK
jgi:signal transduction histidine kinase